VSNRGKGPSEVLRGVFGRGAQAKKLEKIPVGYYHEILETGHPVRRAWHLLKFRRVLDFLPDAPGQSVLDIGCFAGTFLSMLPEEQFGRQVGVDILKDQIDYANTHFGTPFRRFEYVKDIQAIEAIEGGFDCVTLIEVIEHLEPHDVDAVLTQAANKLRPGGRLVVSTPNYASAWPLIERLLNRYSDVTYDEQHITRFTYFDCEAKLRSLSRAVRDDFELELKTTTHLLSPFLAVLGVDVASAVSGAVEHRSWRVPFGNLLMLSFVRK
jgi:2-polyprenyl-3-methyl-5-hydroxy-6-metoxy-1,4-benzoquinol methylase